MQSTSLPRFDLFLGHNEFPCRHSKVSMDEFKPSKPDACYQSFVNFIIKEVFGLAVTETELLYFLSCSVMSLFSLHFLENISVFHHSPQNHFHSVLIQWQASIILTVHIFPECGCLAKLCEYVDCHFFCHKYGNSKQNIQELYFDMHPFIFIFCQ